MRRALRALLSLAAAFAAFGGQSAHAATYGISDGRPSLLEASQLRELAFSHVRLVVPWDAARRAGAWDTWLARAQQDRWSVLVAPSTTGTTPAPADYESALRALLDRYPAIDAVEGWNEPNHAIQPTAGRPALAAAYFEAARRACGSRCTAVAGNLLDAGSMGAYLKAYKAALTTEPAVWGVHNYYDATYFQRDGLDAMLAITKGPIWFTETGGLVSFQPGGPGIGLLPDERRAADSLRWLFQLVKAEPRVERMYLYGMWQEPSNAFDSALLRQNGDERESMAVVRAAIGPRPAAPDSGGSGTLGGGQSAPAPGTAGAANAPAATADAAAGAAPVLRLVGKRITFDRRTRRASLTVRCALAACAGRLTIRSGAWNYGRDVRLAADTTRTIRVRLTLRGLRALAARTGSTRVMATKTRRASLCPAGGGACAVVPLVLR